MSELSELIKINKNIENQNNEIIRLLKKIAGESDVEACDVEEVVEESEDEEPMIVDIFSDVSFDVGEVYFVEDDVFKLTIKNNEITIDNLNR